MSWTTLTFSALEVLSATKVNQLQANFTAVVRGEAGTGNPATTSGYLVTPGSAVVGVSVDQNYENHGILIDSEALNYSCLRINGKACINIIQDLDDSAGTAYAISAQRNLNVAGTKALGCFDSQHTADTFPALQCFSHGTGGCLKIDVVEGLGLAMDVDSASDYGVASFTGVHDGIQFVFHADGGTSNKQGMIVAVGTDDNSGLNTHIAFCDGDLTVVGAITSTDGVTSYSAFTGSHPSKVKGNIEYPYGTILVLDKLLPTKKYKYQTEYQVDISKKAHDKSVFGVFGSFGMMFRSMEKNKVKRENKETGQITHKTEFKNEINEIKCQVYGVGDGHILVCSEGGNIEKGDYLCTSNTEGHGMKQSDDLLHNYTIAKSLEVVDWSKEPDTKKLIVATFHCS